MITPPKTKGSPLKRDHPKSQRGNSSSNHGFSVAMYHFFGGVAGKTRIIRWCGFNPFEKHIRQIASVSPDRGETFQTFETTT